MACTFHREVFSSPVDQVIVVRLTADKPGSISMTAKLDGVTNTKTPGDDQHSTEMLGPGQLLLRGKTGSMLGIEGRVRYEAQVRVLNEGGKLLAEKDGAKVVDARCRDVARRGRHEFQELQRSWRRSGGAGPRLP